MRAFLAPVLAASLLAASHPALAAGKAPKPAKATAAKHATASQRPAENILTAALAASRLEQIRSVSYKLDLTFTAGAEEYAGRVRIDTQLADTTKPLSLDWQGKAPLALAVNGELLKDYKIQPGSLEIPAKVLAKTTVIAIEFRNEFGKEGEGIQHVVDPEDKAEYVYTDFEPYQAHQLLPCFDQPDLKAHFDVTVTAPASWKVIGNTEVEAPAADAKPAAGAKPAAKPEATPAAEPSGLVTRKLATTPLISPYLFFVGAGPFQEWKDQEGKIPLYIHARKSLAKYVDAENLFRTMKKGLRFYSDYFGFEYPFPKFGLVFAPEFGWGGMENPGAIVTNERNLYRGPVPATRREGRDDLILHEMAHHWFGDLVTMKWWNDLWLNESFATYLASLAHDRAFGSKNVWQDFASEKTWGYWQDQLVTTHPIETKVPDTRTARGNFDGITYAKGAATLQQLHFYVGEDAFRSGVQAYFRKHAFGNAERADFIGAIAEAGNLDLAKWTHAWLQTAGVNRISVKWGCSASATDPMLATLTVEQEKSSSGTLSPHRTRIGFFKHDADTLNLVSTIDVALEKKSTPVDVIAEAIPCPDFVFANLDDKDYALYSLDAKSMESVRLVLEGGVADPLLRMQAWNALSQMVRDGKLDPVRYLDLAVKGFRKESDEGVLSVLLGRHSPVRSIYDEYLSPRDRVLLAPGFEQAVFERLTSSEKAGNRQMLFFDFYVRLVQSPENQERLDEWLEKNNPPEGIELDQDRRWAIVLNLARNGYAKAPALIDAEEKRDPSDMGKRTAYGARVALPTAESKDAFWKALEHPEKIPPSTLRSAASEFHQPNQQALSEKYVQSYFERLKKVDWKKTDILVHVYFDGLFPGSLCSKKLLAQSEAALRATKGLTDLARRSWLENNDELRRCVKVGRR